jgi:hypothetical protein
MNAVPNMLVGSIATRHIHLPHLPVVVVNR